MKLYEKSAAELSRLIHSGEITCEQLVSATLSRIDEADGEINAYITVCRDEALEKARALDSRRKSGEPLPALAGIPVAVKDNLCTRGIRTTCASKMLSDFTPPYTATAVERLENAGAVVIGKTNMDEFAMGSSGETSFFGAAKNPHDTKRTAGGSSSGSAAALAAFETTLALGSDTGGSVRQPAAFCGVVGLKPTYGAVSRSGLIAYASSLDVVGPMACTVEDTALLFKTICGRDPLDMTSADRQYPDFGYALNRGVRSLKIGLPREYFGASVDPEVKESVLSAARFFESEGADIIEVSLPSAAFAPAAYYAIACAEASSNLARFDGVKYGRRAENFTTLTELYEKSRGEGFGSEVKSRILMGTMVLSADKIDSCYRRAASQRELIRAEFESVFSTCDIILTPAAAAPAFLLGSKSADLDELCAADHPTVSANLAGVPAISVPCGRTASGLPVGAQLIAPHFCEDRLFAAGRALEGRGRS